LLARKTNLHRIVVLGALLCSRWAAGESGICPVEPGFAILQKAEHEQSRGNTDFARQQFLRLVDSKTPEVAARAAYRLAEIEEDALWSIQTTSLGLKSCIDHVRNVRSAFLKVTEFGDAFWSRRAAYRVLTLMDDAMLRFQSLSTSKTFKTSVSPFSILFSHVFTSDRLNAQISALENERRFLEGRLRAKFRLSDDPALFHALWARGEEGTSPFLGEWVTPPWNGLLPVGVVIKQGTSYYRLNQDSQLTVMPRALAILSIRQALNNFENPLHFAFALAQAVDEQQAVAPALIKAALQSRDPSIKLAGLYAAQKSPSHELTAQLLALWPSNDQATHTGVLFGTAQQLLFGETERLLLALSTHFALGRDSTKKILESALPIEEKAWLLQFRRDKTSIVYAESFLQKGNKVVKTRTQEAMRAWRS
jgi:hypothetical protein